MLSLKSINRFFFIFGIALFIVSFFGQILGQMDVFAATLSTKVKLAENNPISDTSCKIYYMVTGSIAKVISVFIIIITALGFFLGKVSWGIVISITIAVAITFSGRALLSTFVGPRADGGCECKKGSFGYGSNCTAKPVDAGT